MCLFPIKAERQESGRPKFTPEGELQIPCGSCYECLSKRASEWALRCRHEIATHTDNCFLTLTYDDDNLPSQFIVKSHFQKFIKKLRHESENKLRYIVSHEYGGKTGRPHHHAIIFGWTPPNQKFLQMAPSGEPLYTSDIINSLWKNGFHSIGEANEKTAYYIASYSLKRSTTDITNNSTGEYIQVRDSMNVSTRPAIGKEFFLKNMNEIVHNEKLLPRYYKKLLETHNPDLLAYHENNSQFDYTNRSSHEILAKFKITEQKNIQETNLRSTPEDQIKNAHLTRYLKHKRDFDVSYKKGKL